MGNKKETYNGTIQVRFSCLPSLKLVSVIVKEKASWFRHLAEATRRRFFTLDKDWHIELDNVDYKSELNGIITVPAEIEGEPVVFDGASVPLPWLVSFLSIGILRPLGVMLTASIVHDFAFKFGYLLVSSEKGVAPIKIPVERHDIDRLFRDIIGTVNQVVGVGWIAWFFVRLGWLGVKYNGQFFGGNRPNCVLAITTIGLSFLGVYLFEDWQFQRENFDSLVIFSVSSYFIFYIATLIMLWINKA